MVTPYWGPTVFLDPRLHLVVNACHELLLSLLYYWQYWYELFKQTMVHGHSFIGTFAGGKEPPFEPDCRYFSFDGRPLLVYSSNTAGEQKRIYIFFYNPKRTTKEVYMVFPRLIYTVWTIICRWGWFLATSKRAAAIWASRSAITSVTILLIKEPSLLLMLDWVEDVDCCWIHLLLLRTRRSLSSSSLMMEDVPLSVTDDSPFMIH